MIFLIFCENKLSKNESLFCVFVDFRKAFDVVNRPLLFSKLHNLGINGKLYQLVKSMYTNTSNVVRLNNKLSDEFGSENGVLQGNNLSPTLFSLYINSLLEELRNSKIGVKVATDTNVTVNVFAYADDIILLAETESDLSTLLKIVENWCKRWKIDINNSKTK